MSRISTNVEVSCKNHPLLKAGVKLPHNGIAKVTQQRLFTLGTLTLQTAAKPAFADYKKVSTRWQSLHGIYAEWLQFKDKQIITDATSEILTRLSEIVGVALGVAALDAEFKVKINRFQRFQPIGPGRRVDFEYYAKGERFFHETKGTTYEQSVQKMCDSIVEQKKSTLTTLQGVKAKTSTMPVNVSGLTGSVALYCHSTRSKSPCFITLIDPPVEPQPGSRIAREADELACVLRYYQNFYRKIIPNTSNSQSIRLDLWLDEVIQKLDTGGSAPTQSPSNLRTNARASEPDNPGSPYRGVFLDARFTRRSVLRYTSLKEATDHIASPVSFLGVSRSVTNLIQQCRWDDLLSYSDQNANQSESAEDGREILTSGILCKRVNPDLVLESSTPNQFQSLRRMMLATQNNRLRS